MMRSAALRPLASALTALPRARPMSAVNCVCHFAPEHPTISTTRCALFIQKKPSTIGHNAPFVTSTGRFMRARIKAEELKKEQDANRQRKLQGNAKEVTTTSTVRDILEFAPRASTSGDPDMLQDIKSDLKTIRETFAMADVPKEVFWFGMAGLAPYVITSFSTLYLAWDINYVHSNHEAAYLIDQQTAGHLLHILEPTQVGYGAIILSFLGAIHWGLEMAGYGGSHPYRRYLIGILAPALAWPTVLLPLDYALLTQFAGFVGMYFADSQATAWGWAPKWYTTYRFLLTFIVGGCIIATLVGRGQIGDAVTPTEGAQKHFREIRRAQRMNVEKEKREYTGRAGSETEKVKQTHEKSEGPPTDPAKTAKGVAEGTQGVYSDEFQDSIGSRGERNLGQPAEPSDERKGVQKPETEEHTTRS